MDALDELLEAGRGIGDNRPPDDHDPLRERLEEQERDLVRRRDELLASYARAPATVDDDDTCGRVGDLVKLIAACQKNAETRRVGAKEPFLAAGRTVDGFYKRITDPLGAAAQKLRYRMTEFQRAKEAEERRRREEEARRQKEEADRLAREAEERAAALQSQTELDDALTAEEQARQAAADAERANKDAKAKAAELSRTRGNYGSVASLHTFWDFADLDRASLDLETLRNHIPMAALEQAVRSHIKAGGRHLRGVRIFENTTTRVR